MPRRLFLYFLGALARDDLGAARGKCYGFWGSHQIYPTPDRLVRHDLLV